MYMLIRKYEFNDIIDYQAKAAFNDDEKYRKMKVL